MFATVLRLYQIYVWTKMYVRIGRETTTTRTGMATAGTEAGTGMTLMGQQ